MARLQAEIAIEREYADRRAGAAEFRAIDEAAAGVARLMGALADRLEDAAEAKRAGDWERFADELVAVEYYGQDLAEYREACGADDAAGSGEAREVPSP
ncbi:MAG: hypothetical protein J0L88_02345 [Xanthomonadales bacterium]|nr:hypothetical protein [Xanthomonadales bacterium]